MMQQQQQLERLVQGLESMETCVSCLRKVRRGKLLRCFHAVCESCVSEHTHGDGTRLCPRCTRSTESQTSDQLPSLPPDLLPSSSEQQENQSAMGSSSFYEAPVPLPTLCDMCTEDRNAPATHHCLDCSYQLCRNHADDHPKRRRSTGHTVVVMDVASAGQRSPRKDEQLVASINCRLHPRLAMEMFCDTCQSLVCEKCLATGSHQGEDHNVVPLQSAWESTVLAMDEAFGRSDSWDEDADEPKTVWSSYDKLQAMTAEVDGAIKAANDEHRLVSAAIDTEFRRLHELLDRRDKVLREQVDAVYWLQRKPLDAQREAARQSTEECKRATHLLSHLAKCQQPASLLQLTRWLTECASQSAAEATQVPRLLPKIGFARTSISLMRKGIQSAGLVEDNAITVEQAHATVRPCVFVGEKQPLPRFQLDVSVRNRSGVPLSAENVSPLAKWKVVLQLPDGITLRRMVSVLPSASTQSTASGISGLVLTQTQSFDGLMTHLKPGPSSPRDGLSAQSSSPDIVSHQTVPQDKAPLPPGTDTTFSVVFQINRPQCKKVTVNLGLNDSPVKVKPNTVELVPTSGGFRGLSGAPSVRPVPGLARLGKK